MAQVLQMCITGRFEKAAACRSTTVVCNRAATCRWPPMNRLQRPRSDRPLHSIPCGGAMVRSRPTSTWAAAREHCPEALSSRACPVCDFFCSVCAVCKFVVKIISVCFDVGVSVKVRLLLCLLMRIKVDFRLPQSSGHFRKGCWNACCTVSRRAGSIMRALSSMSRRSSSFFASSPVGGSLSPMSIVLMSRLGLS